MAATDGADGPQLETREDISLYAEKQEAVLGKKQRSHDLRIRIARDWIVLAAVSAALVFSFLGMVGMMTWPGPITPTHVFFSVVSGWVGSRLQHLRS